MGDEDENLFYMPVNIRAVTADEQRAGLPTGLDSPPFVFEAEASNNSLDFYYSHMSERTLRNYARDGAAGVQFLDSHENLNLGYGRTFSGRFEEDSERRPVWNLVGRMGDSPAGLEFAIAPPEVLQRAVLGVFTVPGIRFGGSLTYASTDDFERAVRGGLVKSVSVGFGGGQYVCDVCGGNYRDYRACEHLAGFIYEAGEQGTRQMLATVSIDGAELYELSAVYSGATPMATIIKAERLAAAGDMSPSKIQQFERRFKVELPSRTAAAIPDLSRTAHRRPTGGNMSDDILEMVRAVMPDIEFADGVEPVEVIRALTARIGHLNPLAEDGRQYRADLVAEALAEGVRANGAEFAGDSYRAVLESARIEVIQQMRDDWRRLGDARLQGGRQTTDTADASTGSATEQPRPVVPESAYRVD